MTLSLPGIQYICEKFGDVSFCCVETGLSWYYTLAGTNYEETGGTAQIVSRLASGLIDSLTMTSPARGAFTKAELDAANAGPVTLQDAKEITDHDDPTEVQWCFIPCGDHPDQATCEAYGCHWWNDACHPAAPTCESLNNEADCLRYTCYWFRGACHPVDQPGLCYWIDDQGGPAALTISIVFTIIDAYTLNEPPAGYTFIPTIENIFGIIDYYLGFNGDAKTGCSYY